MRWMNGYGLNLKSSANIAKIPEPHQIPHHYRRFQGLGAGAEELAGDAVFFGTVFVGNGKHISVG